MLESPRQRSPSLGETENVAVGLGGLSSDIILPVSISKSRRIFAMMKSPFVRCARNNPQTLRLAVFFICYFVFLGPLLVALAREYADFLHSLESEPVQHPSLLLPIMSNGGPAFLIASSEWLLVLLAIYLAFRVLGPKLGIKLHDKTLAKHKDDLLRLLYFGMAMATMGGISARIEEGVVNTQTGLSFIPLVVCYSVFYTFIFELLKDKNITISIGLFDPSVPKLTIIVLLTSVLTCLLVLVCLFLTAYQVGQGFFAMYCGVTAVGFVLHAFMFLVSCFPGIDGRSFVHLHHWYWSVPLAHMCVFHTDVSMLSQAIFLAVHVHGVDCFGVEPLFYDTERRARHPSDFDWILKEHIHERREYDDYVPNEEEIILILPKTPHQPVDSADAAESGRVFATQPSSPRSMRSSSSPRLSSVPSRRRNSSITQDRMRKQPYRQHHFSPSTAAAAAAYARHSLNKSRSNSFNNNNNNSSSSSSSGEEDDFRNDEADALLLV